VPDPGIVRQQLLAAAGSGQINIRELADFPIAMSPAALRALYTISNEPDAARNGGHIELTARCQVAANPNTPRSILQTIPTSSRPAGDLWVLNRMRNNPELPPERASEIEANLNTFRDSIRAAHSQLTPPEALEQLVEAGFFEAAGNPGYPVSRLRQLASSSDMTARRAVANNPGCPVDILEQFSDDPMVPVREATARNPSTPLHVLEKLLRDPDSTVTKMVTQNQNLPTATLAMWQLTHT